MKNHKEGTILNNVLIGKEGYFFLYNGGQEQFTFLLGEKTPSQASIKNFIENIESRLIYLKNKNINFNHIIFPSKPVIKKKTFPKNLRK